MKKIFILLCSIAAIWSCQKAVSESENVFMNENRIVSLDVSVPDAMTRVAVNDAQEKQINNIQLFLFNDRGVLEKYLNTDEISFRLSCTTGAKEIVVFANAPECNDVRSLSQLEGLYSDLNSNSVGNFVMTGRIAITLSADVAVEIPVKRLVAKIVLEKVENAFTLPQHQSMDFVLKKVYVQNVPAQCAYLTEKFSAPSLWYNKMSLDENCIDLLADKAVERKIAYGESYTAIHSFFTYPNGMLQDSVDEVWCPRKTRFVLETELGGNVYYYPITLDMVQSNKLYRVSLKVTMPGVDKPEVSDIKDAYNFQVVVVEEWEDVDPIEEVI